MVQGDNALFALANIFVFLFAGVSRVLALNHGTNASAPARFVGTLTRLCIDPYGDVSRGAREALQEYSYCNS